MKAIRTLAALLLATAGLAASAGENIADFAHQLRVEPEGAATWYRLDIPLSVRWQAAHADLRDLRIVNAEGEFLPYALTEHAPQSVRNPREAAARLFPLYADTADDGKPGGIALDGGVQIRRNAQGEVEIELAPVTTTRSAKGSRKSRSKTPQKTPRGWLLDTQAADFPLERLKFVWTGNEEGFFRFSIEASDDLEHWQDWGEGQIVHMRFDGQSIQQRETALSGTQARYLRIVFTDAEAAANVRGVQLVGAVTDTAPAPFVWSPALAGEPVPEREREYTWRLPLSLPLQRVRLVMDEANTLAPVIVSGRDESLAESLASPPRRERRIRDKLKGRNASRANAAEPSSWRVLASGVVYRLPANAGERVADELELPGRPVSQLRLQIDRRGSGLGQQAASAPRIEVALRGVELAFLARGSAPYKLVYGKADAQAASLPLSTLIPGELAAATASGQLGRARIAEGDTEPEPTVFAPPKEPVPKASRPGKAVLWGILIVGVFLLFGMVVSLVRSMKNDLRER